MVVDVVTNRYDQARLGANLFEDTLSPANVNDREFGKVFSRKVDGDMHAQPLVVSGVVIGGARRTVVYVATENNSVYAFDAEDPRCTEPYWHISPRELGAPVPRGDVGGTPYRDFASTIGITSTPAIDKDANTIYFEVKSKQSGAWYHHLHARDLSTGEPRAGSPMRISAEVPRQNADGSPTIVFDPRGCLNRPGLLLMDGVLYLGFGSHGDHFSDHHEYHGWVLAYSAADLEPLGAFCATSAGNQGGIWQSGAGLSGDGTFVYCVVGNGDGASGPGNFGNTIVKLHLDRANKQISAVAWFTPPDVAFLNEEDLDLSTGAVYVKDPRLLVGCGKSGRAYVLDPAESQQRLPLLQTLQASTFSRFTDADQVDDEYSNIHGAPIVWQGPRGLGLYVWGEHDYLKHYAWDGSAFQFVERSSVHVPSGMPGGILALSANRDRLGDTAIVWAAHPYARNANMDTVDGILRAFDANDVSIELWNTEMRPDLDRLGKFAKFCPPVVANGKVYMATFADPDNARDPNQLVVYGPLSERRQPLLEGWYQRDVGTPLVGSAAFDGKQWTVSGSGWDIESTMDEFHFVYRRVSGDFSIRAMVTSVAYTNEWAKAGVMIRHDLDTASAHAMTAMTPTSWHGVVFQSRAWDGAKQVTANDHVSADVPACVNLVRSGGQIIGKWKRLTDADWTTLGSVTMYAPSELLVGLAVTAHHPEPADLRFNRATFEQVTIEGRPAQ